MIRKVRRDEFVQEANNPALKGEFTQKKVMEWIFTQKANKPSADRGCYTNTVLRTNSFFSLLPSHTSFNSGVYSLCQV